MEQNLNPNSQMIGGTVKEIAGKTLTDKRYLNLFDKGTQNLVNAYIETNPKIEKIPLSTKDYNLISRNEEIKKYEESKLERWERKDNYHAFIKEFIIDENKEYGVKSIVDAFNKLDSEAKERYTEYGVEDTVNLMQASKNILVGTKSLKEIQHFHTELIKFIHELKNEKMEKNFEKEKYLQNQMKYLGFGESKELYEALKKGIEGNENEFQIKTTSDKTLPGNSVDFILNFRKIKNEAVFLNSYDANLTNEKGEVLSHRFKVKKEDNITAKEAINLLEGRAVKTAFVNSKTNEKEPTFIKLKLNEEKNSYGNYKLDFYNAQNIDVPKIMEKSNLIFDKEEYKDFTLKSLEKGNLATVKFKHEGNDIEGKASLNPQYKTLNLYDSEMNRLNTNKPIEGVDIEENERSRIRQHNTKRSL